MRLHDLADSAESNLLPIVMPEHFDPVIRWVVTTDMLDPSRYLSGGELVLTGMMWRTEPADSRTFVEAIARAGVAALAASEDGAVPEDLIHACREFGLPLFRVPADVAFATVTESVVRRLSRARTSDVRSVLDRHRRLVYGAQPGEVGPLLDLVGTEVGLECRVLSASGRVVAGPPGGPDPARLAREFLTARRLPHHIDDLDITLLSTDGDAAARVVDWFVAIDGDWQSWHPERLAVVEQLTSIVALERARSDDRLTGSGVLAQEFVRAVSAGADVSDIRDRMDALDLSFESSYVAISAAVSTDVLRLGELRQLVREVVPHTSASAVGIVGSEVIAIVPADVDPTGHVKDTTRNLGPGLVGTGLSIGVSSPTAPTHLRSALEEARHARHLSAHRPDDEYVVGHGELATLVVLLAGVPDDVRVMFRSRLLSPLVEYDDMHGSDLVATLSTFLDTNGSWTRCAEQMHLHVNSLRYRIQRVEELTGRDLSRLDDRVEFYLALRLG